MRLLLLGLSLLLAGCSLNPSVAINPSLSQRIPSRAEITDTPFFQQAAFQCGPAALAMVLNYYHAGTSPEQLAGQVFTPKAKGSFPVEMDIASRRQGFVSYPVNNLENLLLEIAAGHPVLVLQNLSIAWFPQWHFAVVVGYDLESQNIILRSGDLQRRITPFSVFENTWARSERWGRVVIPPDQLPASADPTHYTARINELEQVGYQALAQQAYFRASEAWPESHLPRFALANTLLSTGQTDAALEQYRQLLAQHPQLAQGWNNYAYALQAQGCYLQAQQAASCGLKLVPLDANLQDTNTEMSALLPQPKDNCPAVLCPATTEDE